MTSAKGGSSRLAALAGLSAGALAWLAHMRWSSAFYERAFHFPLYQDAGEALLHRAPSAARDIAFHLPLSTLSAALLAHHPWLGAAWVPLCQVIEACLVFALCALLQPFACVLPAAALAALGLAGRRGSYGYAQLPYSLLVLLAAGIVVWRAQAPSARRSAVLALTVGVTLLFRSPLALFTPILALYEFLVSKRRAKGRSKQLLILALAPYLLLLPWMRMNWTVYRRFIPFENGQANWAIVSGALGLVGTIEGDWAALMDDPGYRNRPWAVPAWAAREVFRHPLRYGGACLERAAYAVSFHPALFIFALLGFWLNRGREDFRQLGLLAAYFLGIHCLLTLQETYLLPLWPLLAVLAGSSLLRLWKRDRIQEHGLGYRAAEQILKASFALALGLGLYALWVVTAYANVAAKGPAAWDESLEQALARYPGEPWLLRERADRRLERGDFSGAIDDLSRAAALAPDDAELKLQLDWARMLAGRPQPLLAWTPRPWDSPFSDEINIKLHVFKAYALVRGGRTREALSELGAAREIYNSWVMVRGRRTERVEKALEKMRSPEGFVWKVQGILRGRPAAEKRAFLSELFRLTSQTSS